MANKNTLRNRKAKEKEYKRGCAVDSNRNGKWVPKLSKEEKESVLEIRRLTKKIYGGSV